jgi:phenylalanyl-tRNA synthetase beta chain
MKLSLAWIFDHIDRSWRDLDVDDLVQRFNNTTAEVDYYRKIVFDLDSLALGRFSGHRGDDAVFFVSEWNREVILPVRKDLEENRLYVIKKEKKQYRYASLADFHAEKEGLLPALSCSEELIKGEWKKACENEDYILIIDNKSLTHRPDLWGHRGIAREMAALIGCSLVAEERFLTPCIIKNYDYKTPATAKNPISLEIASPELCTRLAGVYISQVTVQASFPLAAQRLARIDARPIDALVDATNYVMYDIGQPMHAFDASVFDQGRLVAVAAAHNQKLELLDGETITLNDTDCVISNGEKPLSLAGIMGGAQSGIHKDTCSVLVESAHFNPVAIRRSSMRHKKRTEASARFEKGLDPNQNTIALMRFLALLSAWDVSYQSSKEIVSAGALAREREIIVYHDFIVKKLGATLSSEEVSEILIKLGFGVQESIMPQGIRYTVTVPTYRLRDIEIKEDIVEEIARSIGYANIPYQLPVRSMIPVDHYAVHRLREIKRQCAFGIGMHEIVNYPLYDEEFLQSLSWQPADFLEISNPVSENWRRLVTSLVPHLLKAIALNNTHKQHLRFFEWGRIWRYINKQVHEENSLALIWYSPREELDFYEIKAELSTLFDLLKIPILWRKPRVVPEVWYHPYQTAELVSDEQLIGFAGIVAPLFLKRVAAGSAFVAELDGSFLQSFRPAMGQIMPLPKYQHTDLDISMLVPVGLTVSVLEDAIASADARVRDVYLVDYYHNPEYPDKRSVTIRYRVYDEFKTLTKEEIDEVAQAVAHAVVKYGVTIR